MITGKKLKKSEEKFKKHIILALKIIIFIIFIYIYLSKYFILINKNFQKFIIYY